MALFTPRGLKVRLPMSYAFALIARVYPRSDAFRVLQLTEGSPTHFLPQLTARGVPLLIQATASSVCSRRRWVRP